MTLPGVEPWSHGPSAEEEEEEEEEVEYNNNDNSNSETEMGRKTTAWIFQATNKRNLTQ